MKDKILSILSEIRPEFDFSEDVNFFEEGMLDSFDIVTLIAELETQFDIKIAGIDVTPENFSTIDSIEALVKKSGTR